MKLAAWGLITLGSPQHERSSLKLLVFTACRSSGLMFRIRDIGDLPVPAASTVAAFIALVLGRACLALSRDSAGPRPPGRVFTVDHMA